MSAVMIAGARQVETDDAQAFLRGLNRGRLAELVGDTDRVLRALVTAGDYSGIAGFMEALAVAHAEAEMPAQPADPFWSQHVRHRLRGAR